MKRNEVQVCPTKRGCAYAIRLVVNGRTFTMGTGGYGLTYEDACKEADEISTQLGFDLTRIKKREE